MHVKCGCHCYFGMDKRAHLIKLESEHTTRFHMGVVPIYHEGFLIPRRLYSLCFPILKRGMQLCH